MDGIVAEVPFPEPDPELTDEKVPRVAALALSLTGETLAVGFGQPEVTCPPYVGRVHGGRDRAL